MYAGIRDFVRDSNQSYNATLHIAASTTNSYIVTATAGKKIRVLSAFMMAGATATELWFGSMTISSNTSVKKSCLFQQGVRTPVVLPFNEVGWFETDESASLSVNTLAGSATGVQITYIKV